MTCYFVNVLFSFRNNKIYELNFHRNLNNNDIDTLNENTFIHLKQLIDLKMNHNRLKTLPAFSEMKNLRRL